MTPKERDCHSVRARKDTEIHAFIPANRLSNINVLNNVSLRVKRSNLVKNHAEKEIATPLELAMIV